MEKGNWKVLIDVFFDLWFKGFMKKYNFEMKNLKDIFLLILLYVIELFFEILNFLMVNYNYLVMEIYNVDENGKFGEKMKNSKVIVLKGDIDCIFFKGCFI